LEQVADAHLFGQQTAEALRVARDVRAAEIAPGGVGHDVGARRRRGEEANQVVGELRRHQSPAHEVRVRLRLAGSGLVEHQRRVYLRPLEWLATSPDGESMNEIELDAGVVYDRGERCPRVALEEDVRRERGDPLR